MRISFSQEILEAETKKFWTNSIGFVKRLVGVIKTIISNALGKSIEIFIMETLIKRLNIYVLDFYSNQENEMNECDVKYSERKKNNVEIKILMLYL